MYGDEMIEINNVSKNYGELTALDDVSLTIHEGELFGLLGPNGAGKSTLINLMNTYLKLEHGEILINNKSVKSETDQVKKLIGIIPQEIALYDELTAFENLKFWGEIYGIGSKELKKRCDETLKLVGLFDRRNDSLKKYSGGMKRRINIAAGLLHNPDVILMDEPTVGVDPQSRNFIFEMIEQLNSIGKTIVYTTHYMEEAERLCKRIAIIDSGKIIACGEKPELYKLLEDENTITISFTENISARMLQDAFENIETEQLSERKVKFKGKEINKQLPDITAVIKALDLSIADIDFNKPNLEKLFLKLTGRELRDD
jgi:ABC-2 type transport system ATP-binding protein